MVIDPFTLFLISSIATLGSTALDAKLSSDAAKRTENATIAALERQRNSNKESQVEFDSNLDEFKDSNRKVAKADRVSDNQETLLQSLTRDLNVNQGQTQGKLSKDFVDTRKSNNKALLKEGTARTFNAAKVLAPQQQASDETITNALSRLAQSSIRLSARDKSGVDKIRIQNAGKINGTGKLFSNVLKGIGAAAGTASTLQALQGVGTAASIAPTKAVNPSFGLKKLPTSFISPRTPSLL